MNSNSTYILWSLLLVAIATGVGAPEALADDGNADSDDEEQAEGDALTEEILEATGSPSWSCADLWGKRDMSRPELTDISHSHEIQVGETDEEELESALERGLNNFSPCLRSLLPSGSDEETFEGAFTLRLTVRDDIYDTGRFSGGITGVELLDSDFDEESETGECVISEHEDRRFRFPPSQGESPALIVEVTYEFRVE